MIENYERPADMPKVSIDDDGIVIVEYGSTIVTTAHVVYAVDEYRKLNGEVKMPVMTFVEMARNVQGDMSEIGNTSWVKDVTSALAVVTTTKIANILGNIFIKFQKNPYPTKMFSSESKARKWLQQYK